MKENVAVRMEPEQLERVDAWTEEHAVGNRSEAIRELTRIGLERSRDRYENLRMVLMFTVPLSVVGLTANLTDLLTINSNTPAEIIWLAGVALLGWYLFAWKLA